MKKLTLWTRYARLGASSRLRFYNLVPFLENCGWEITLCNFFDDNYLHKLYTDRKKSPVSLFQAWRRRFHDMRRTPDNIPALIEYELLPYLPFAAEKNFLASRRYVLNFDDDIFLRYRNLPFLKNKFPHLLRNSAGVICANEHLLKIAGAYHSDLCKIPTAPPPVVPGDIPKAEKFTLIWIGSPETFPFLAAKSSALRRAAEKCDFKLLIVGGTAPLPGIDSQLIPWSEIAEDRALKCAHAGIMPLPQTPFALGKSAYKLIRYQQYALPAIASPVGENCHVLQHAHTGFLADGDDEWVEAIIRLSDAGCREKMIPAITAAAEKYRLENISAKLDAFLTETLLCFDKQ